MLSSYGIGRRRNNLRCDFCGSWAVYDGRTIFGPWAYLCEACFQIFGVGLGLGRGQILRVTQGRR